MNILIVTAMYPPIQTGTSFYSRNLAAALQAQGHKVAVMTLKNAELQEPDCDGFPVRRLPAIHFPVKNYFKHFRMASFFPQNYWALFREAKRWQADIIFLVNHYLDIAFLAVATAIARRTPLICSIGTQLQSTNPRRDKLLNVLDRLICGRLIFPFCDRIVSWDSQIHQYLADVHGEPATRKSVIVPYGINGDAACFLEHAHDYRLHNQILGVGAVIEQRNFLFLVRLFQAVAHDFPDLRLKIIGHVYFDAAVRLATELGLANRITFAGELPHTQVVEELKQSDAYFGITTGKYTGLGTATIEAMLLGLPVFSNAPTDLLGSANLIDLQHYVYVSTDDVSLAAAKLRKILRNPELRATIGAGGRQFVAEHLNWQNVAQAMTRLFESVCRERNTKTTLSQA